MSGYRFGCDDYRLSIYPKEAHDGWGGFDIDKVERVEVEWVDFVRERTCYCVNEDEQDVCSECGESWDYVQNYCSNCGAKVVKR